MFCVKCGNEAVAEAAFCGHCGTQMSVLASAPPVGAATASSTPPPVSVMAPPANQVRPWVRYWARMFDIYVAAIVVGITVGVAAPHALDQPGSDQLFGVAVIFFWVFIESLLLSTMGTTPGKWLFKTRLVAPSGGKPSYSAAISRSFKVWWRGLGIGFPIASLITLIVAHGNLTKTGITTWDRDDGFTVVHDRIGPVRIIFAVIAFLLFFILVVIGTVGAA
ncbi:RDD family protein [Rhodanobacter lindaniclasticus]|uniref:RDD domain-containing protein n=1 Tax=Rhodanobacter lindaniclasticus TaxID=75310 RepID=A0A4S3KJN5_9GAMM|nr:hypothetical protein B1991_04445 [Rhodanobacter lindaniclasticus]